MHTEAGQSEVQAGPAFVRFMSWVRGFLPEEKYKKFAMLVMHPLPTVELVHSVYADLERALYGEDRFVRTEFVVDEYEDDFNAFLERQKDTEFWRGKFFDAIKTAVNSVLIIDLPAIQNTDWPEPFQYLVKIEDLRDIQVKEDGVCEYISWFGGLIVNEDKTTTRYGYVFDDEFYRTFRQDNARDWVLDREVRHSLFAENGSVLSGPGYCPAKAICSERIHASNNLLRSNPITKSLASLDKILFWEISIEYYETYGAFPMYWMYREICPYEDEFGNACENGFVNKETNSGIRDGDGNWIMEVKQIRCPACLNRSIVGAGTVKEVDAPADKDDSDLREPMGYVGVDANALTYLEKRLAARKLEFYRNCVGRGGETPNEVQAINEAQVQGNFESKQSRLINFKKSWEETHTWSNKTKAIFRYSRENFVKNLAYYGVEFFLKSEAQLQKQLADQRTAGAPQYQIAALRQRIDATQYRENDDMRTRARVLSQLEPYPDLSMDQVQALAEKVPNFLFARNLELKSNFANYVQEFERENNDVVRFGSKIPFEQKIKTIKTKLYEYVERELKAPGTRIVPIGYGEPTGSAVGRDGKAPEGK